MNRGPGFVPPRVQDGDTETPRGLKGALAALEIPQYRWLFGGNICFFLAMEGQRVVRAWIAYELTGSELALGIVTFVVAVPMLLIAPIGGVLSDRWERRRLIITGQAVVIGSELAMYALLLTDMLRFWHLVVGALVMGTVFPFIMPARQAIVANTVGRRRLTNAMALGMMGMNATRVLGPTVAGVSIGIVGTDLTYGIGVSLYLLAFLTLFRLERTEPTGRSRELSVLQNLGEGTRYVRENPLVLVLLLFGLVPMFLAMPFQTLLVVFAEDVWEVGATGLGLLNGAGGIGGVIGSFYVAWHADSHRRMRTMMFSMMAFGIFLLLFSMTPWFTAGLGLILLANAFASIYGALNNTAIQVIIPDEVRGRISSFLMMSFSLPLLGTLPMSAVAEALGAPFAVGLASVLAMVVALAFYASSPSLRGMDASVRAAVERS